MSGVTEKIRERLLTEEGLKELTDLAREGKTIQEIASRYGITRKTFYQWSTKYPEINSALVEGKTIADERVEMSLYDCCFGHKEKEISVEQDADGNIIKRTIKEKYIPPNVQAIQYWLANRSNGKWKARQQLELTGDSVIPVRFIEDIPNPFKDRMPKDKSDKE